MNITVASPESQNAQQTQPENATGNPSQSVNRRHDLDALRAIAMLLGIVLHAALSFAPIPWTVQDAQQSNFFYVLFAFIHGFRMPLFFLLSGFFTAMLWRKRGLASLVKHRLKRIFLPLAIGCFSIVPAMWIASYIASQPSPFCPESPPLFAAVVSGDAEQVRVELQKPETDVNVYDADSGSTPLCAALFFGHTEITEMLIEAGADANHQDRKNTSPLHVATFMGRAKEAAMLLKEGADVNAIDGNGQSIQKLLLIDFGTTNFFSSSLGVPVEETELLAGRKEIAEMLGEPNYVGSGTDVDQANQLEGLKGLFFYLPVFMHLWFLWFLCWLVAAFLIYAAIVNFLKIKSLPRWLIGSPLSLLWLIPITALAQSFMSEGSFGPDSSVGLLPIPSVLVYYAIFFFFGAIYWDANDASCRLGRWWYISLPVAMLIIFPLALDLVSGTFGWTSAIEDQSTGLMIGNFLQATFAWLMTFGSIGLFHRFCSVENKALRYVSDSSYWLYLIHLPLVILAQWLVRDLQISPYLKFAIITITISVFLLFTYQYGVRYTFIGRLLNGPRSKVAPS